MEVVPPACQAYVAYMDGQPPAGSYWPTPGDWTEAAKNAAGTKIYDNQPFGVEEEPYGVD